MDEASIANEKTQTSDAAVGASAGAGATSNVDEASNDVDRRKKSSISSISSRNLYGRLAHLEDEEENDEQQNLKNENSRQGTDQVSSLPSGGGGDIQVNK